MSLGLTRAITKTTKATAIIAFVSPLLCFGGGTGATDGSLDGAVVGSWVGVGATELLGLAVGDGEGASATIGTLGKLMAAENVGLNARTAEMTPAAMAGARINDPPTQFALHE